LKRIFVHSLIIAACASVLGLGGNFPLLKRYLQGEFRQSFLAPEKYPGLAFISLAEAQDLFVGRQALFVDSRSSEEYSAGHILGAINIPLEEKKAKETVERLGIPPSRIIVVYCHGGDCQMSIGLARLLSTAGFKAIKIYSGGWAEWAAAGLPVEK
jgi:rhodanese-related sulfurtransferase